MFGDSDRDLAQFLMTAERQAIDRCHFNQHEALGELARIIANDRRFDAYDAAKLADRVSRVRHSGAVLDLTDSDLVRGGSPRYDPLKGGGGRYAY